MRLDLFDATRATSGLDATSATSGLCVNFKSVVDGNASFLIIITAHIKDNMITNLVCIIISVEIVA